MTDPEDFTNAACRNHPAGIAPWFPSLELGSNDRQRHRLLTIARTVCAGCEHRQACLDWAIVNRMKDGVWGGHTTSERAGMRPKNLPPPERGESWPAGRIEQRIRPDGRIVWIAHGTTRGRKAHNRLGEPACAECRAGDSAENKARKRRVADADRRRQAEQRHDAAKRAELRAAQRAELERIRSLTVTPDVDNARTNERTG